MTNYRLKLNQVREILEIPVKLESAMLEDGSIVTYESLEIGYPIFQEDNVTPLAEGTYVLEDGTKVEVDENGLISDIVKPEEAPVEEAQMSKVDTEEKPVEEVTLSNDDIIVKLQENIKTIMESIVLLADELSTVKEQLKLAEQKVEEFSKAPATKKIPKVSIPDNLDNDRITNTIEAIKQARKK
ncbi:MAG: hypothetical protein WC124_12215 [Desulfoplanes sp.]|jgi:hypothetical protein